MNSIIYDIIYYYYYQGKVVSHYRSSIWIFFVNIEEKIRSVSADKPMEAAKSNIIGAVTVIVVSLVGLVIIISDIPMIYRHTKRLMWANTKHIWRKWAQISLW